jgi:glutathione-specific gamma-glutamylcyclotransferase
VSEGSGPERPQPAGPARVWVFGYGSLIWRPGFPYRERRPALLEGYHRAFVRYSHHHRGTPERPGLVVGLREGGSCPGVVYGVAPADEAAMLAYLDEREGAGYLRRSVPVRFSAPAAPAVVPAWAYVPNPAHPTYFGEQDRERLVQLVATGRGQSGTALDYLRELVEQLRRLGAEEPELADVLTAAERYRPPDPAQA